MLRVTIGEARQLHEGVWLAELQEAELRQMGGRRARTGAVSVFGLTTAPSFDGERSELELDPEAVETLNLGSGGTALFVLLGATPKTEPKARRARSHPRPRPRGVKAGDRQFLKDLPPVLEELGTALLEAVRSWSPGELTYKEPSGKYVESPDNFWVVRIQPRDRSLRIIVRGRPTELRAGRSIELKPDMGTYSSFKIARPGQMNDAVDVIRQASQIRRGRTRRLRR